MTPQLRPAAPGDTGLLRAVFDATRGPLLAALPPQQRDHLLAVQWAAQRQAFAASHPTAVDHVIEVANLPTGRLLLARTKDRIDVVDMAILPDHRGRGIGTAVLRAVIAEASESGRPVHLHVARDNQRAIRLYRRLGFEASGPGTPTHVPMVHRPG